MDENINVPMNEESNLPPSDENKENQKNGISADLIRGHINTIILRTLYDGDKYGYEIMNEIEQKSHGQYELKQPTLYSALKRLESQGYIKAYWKTDEVTSGGRRKYFTLTDTGRNVTETNQKEWEYSRTIIDSLVSNKSFDFTQPAPSPVDFRILTQSTSRVPNQKQSSTTSDEQQATQDVSNVENINLNENKSGNSNEQVVNCQSTTENIDEENRRRHENYLKLISKPAPTVDAPSEVVRQEKTETDNFIYVTKPETERDYKNLINNIYNRTIRPSSVSVSEPPQTTAKYTNDFNDAGKLADSDGLKINYANTQTQTTYKSAKSTFNLGKTLLVCSTIAFVFMLLESLVCLIFADAFNMDWRYPVILLAIASAQMLVSVVMWLSKRFEAIIKPASHGYRSASIIVTILLILIIVVIAFLLDVNIYLFSDIIKMLVMPSITALTIPLYTTSFYLITKD